MMQRASVRLLGVAVVAIVAGVAHAEATLASEADASDAQVLSRLEARVAHAPHDADAQFNLGRHYAAADALGHAILSFERAQRAAPRDRQIDDALALARAEASRRRADAAGSAVMVQGESPRIARWRFFGGVPAPAYGAALVLGAWLACGAFVLARRSVGTRRDLAAWATGAAAVTALVGAAGWLGATWTAADVRPGVIVAAEPRWRDAPDELATARRSPNLYTGGVVELGEARDAWQEVVLVDRSRGWVARDVVVPIATSRR